MKIDIHLVLIIIRPTVKKSVQSELWFNFYGGFWSFFSPFSKNGSDMTKKFSKNLMVTLILNGPHNNKTNGGIKPKCFFSPLVCTESAELKGSFTK